MKICECCGKENDGTYGSGRFCSQFCAKSFATKISGNIKSEKAKIQMLRQREDPNFVLKSKNIPGKISYQKLAMTNEVIDRIRKSTLKRYEKRLENAPFADMPEATKRKRVLLDQDRKCFLCGQGECWNGKFLVFQLDHIDGNSDNNSRENLRLLCPNCHSQTPTYGTRGVSGEQKIKMLRGLAFRRSKINGIFGEYSI